MASGSRARKGRNHQIDASVPWLDRPGASTALSSRTTSASIAPARAIGGLRSSGRRLHTVKDEARKATHTSAAVTAWLVPSTRASADLSTPDTPRGRARPRTSAHTAAAASSQARSRARSSRQSKAERRKAATSPQMPMHSPSTIPVLATPSEPDCTGRISNAASEATSAGHPARAWLATARPATAPRPAASPRRPPPAATWAASNSKALPSASNSRRSCSGPRGRRSNQLGGGGTVGVAGFTDRPGLNRSGGTC
jgi:hypothetical protein